MTTTNTESTTESRGAGPLTTVFTTPDFCQSLNWANAETPPLSSTICMPPRFNQLYNYGWGFYSPGICPSGYTKGCSFPTSLASKSSDGWVYFGGPMVAGETVQVCCPSGYTCLTNTVSSYSKCVATTDADELAFAIHVRWKESDLSVLETNPTVPGLTNSSPATVTATATQSGASSGSSVSVAIETSKATSNKDNVASESDSATSEPLSSAATIGIALGAMGLAFVLSALAFFLWRCRKRRREDMSGTRLQSTVSLVKMAPGFTEKPELDSQMVTSTEKPELDSQTVASSLPSHHELPSEHVAEMPVAHFVAELPGSMPMGYQERTELEAYPVSPADTARPSESVVEPSPLSETSGSRIRRMSFKKSFKESPTLPELAAGEGSLRSFDGSGPRRRRSTFKEASDLPQPLTLQDPKS